MSRILLVDDSPHAQRIGERILTSEGFEVVTVSSAETALVRIEDVDPDVVIADTVMPGRTGYEICQYLKMSPRHRHVRVILTSGVLETLDEAEAQRVLSDGSLKKPFEATPLVSLVRQLAEESARERRVSAGGRATLPVAVAPSATFVAVVDAEQVRAAVAVALDASMDAMTDEIARRVLTALQTRKSELKPVETASERATVMPPSERVEPIRRVSPLRVRSSILDLGQPDSE